MSVAARRSLGASFGLLSLYYAWFFALRQEPFTMVQMVTLWCAAAMVLLAARSPRRATWLRWAAVAVAFAIAAVVFVVMDRDSHSASDTLNRIVPTYALLVALLVTTL